MILDGETQFTVLVGRTDRGYSFAVPLGQRNDELVVSSLGCLLSVVDRLLQYSLLSASGGFSVIADGIVHVHQCGVHNVESRQVPTIPTRKSLSVSEAQPRTHDPPPYTPSRPRGDLRSP